MKTRTCEPNLHSTSIAMHKESHVGSKFKPKIRIVHIIAPEIIKTDVANFRELVQRLTGKPGGRQCGKKKARCSSSDVSESDVSESVCGFRNSGYGERVKEEEEMWGDENAAFFGGLGDLDGFIQGLGDFPLLPLSSSHMDVFGEGRIS
eukprot:TRINITY_DN70834_c0_g1_i1.p1 TRINITY_DN70834_c0_g1~~TRINITY_DN70834_c0_g1_i1.p1  ORF type:complete len:149 (-),score=17.60 TRINITY_DN70834_c0_g1_i1:25-471(-)